MTCIVNLTALSHHEETVVHGEMLDSHVHYLRQVEVALLLVNGIWQCLCALVRIIQIDLWHKQHFLFLQVLLRLGIAAHEGITILLAEVIEVRCSSIVFIYRALETATAKEIEVRFCEVGANEIIVAAFLGMRVV